MFFKLFLLFAVIPVVELALLIQIGSIIGTFNTIAIVILTAITGAYMVKLEGIGVFSRMQRDMAQGIFPADELLNGVLILVAGALLLTPGFFTDILGFLMVFPGSREIIKKIVKRYLERHMDMRRF